MEYCCDIQYSGISIGEVLGVTASIRGTAVTTFCTVLRFLHTARVDVGLVYVVRSVYLAKQQY